MSIFLEEEDHIKHFFHDRVGVLFDFSTEVKEVGDNQTFSLRTALCTCM